MNLKFWMVVASAICRLKRSTEAAFDQTMIEQLVRSYVLFSGQNFPYILVPLMAEHNVMINPARPLAIYQSMSLHLDRLDLLSRRLSWPRTR